MAWVAVPIVAANLGIVGWLSRRMSSRQIAARFSAGLAVAMVAIVIPDSQGVAVGHPRAERPGAGRLPAGGRGDHLRGGLRLDEQGSALGSNQSLQVGAEALSGVVGGLLAAVAVFLPLTAMAALALVASLLLAREGRPAAVPAAP